MKHCKHCKRCEWSDQEDDPWRMFHRYAVVQLNKEDEDYCTCPDIEKFEVEFSWDEFKDMYCSCFLREIDERYDTVLSWLFEEGYLKGDMEWLAQRADELGFDNLAKAAQVAMEHDTGIWMVV